MATSVDKHTELELPVSVEFNGHHYEVGTLTIPLAITVTSEGDARSLGYNITMLGKAIEEAL